MAGADRAHGRERLVRRAEARLAGVNPRVLFAGALAASGVLAGFEVAFGSPAYSASGLLKAPEDARVAADQLLAQAEELRLTPVDHPARAGGPPPVVADGTVTTLSSGKLPHRPRRGGCLPTS